MKKIWAFGLLLTSTVSFAEVREINCQQIAGITEGAFGMTVDNSSFDSGSNFFSITQASWSYGYMGAQMICSPMAISLIRKETFKCIGFSNQSDSTVEVSVSLTNGEGQARIPTHGSEKMTVPCRLSAAVR